MSNLNDGVELKINTTKGVKSQLKRILASGLYGQTIEEAAERVLAESLEEKKIAAMKLLPENERYTLVNWNPE